MRHFGDIEAIRLLLHAKNVPIDEFPAKTFGLKKRPDPWHTSIIRESVFLSEYSMEATEEAIELFDSELESRRSSSGRVIEPAFPIQLSHGIGKMAEILDRSERKLTRFRNNLEFYSSKATFQTNTFTEELSKAFLNISWRTIDLTRLTLQSYMWMQWIAESLEQANRFGGLLQTSNYFSKHTENAFGYIAHPPLVVATLSCTAMIEEVGAEYINKITDMNVNPDKTRCSDILHRLEKWGIEKEGFDLNSIRDIVVDARNEMSHYISSRGKVVTVEGFDEYLSAILRGLFLVKRLLDELLADTYQKEVDLLDSVSKTIE